VNCLGELENIGKLGFSAKKGTFSSLFLAVLRVIQTPDIES